MSKALLEKPGFFVPSAHKAFGYEHAKLISHGDKS